MIIGHPVFCTTNLLVCVCAFILKCSYCCALLRLLFPVLITWTLTPVADCFSISFDPMSIKAGGGQLTDSGLRNGEERVTGRQGLDSGLRNGEERVTGRQRLDSGLRNGEERVTGRHRLVLREKEKEHGRSSGSSLRSNGSSAASEATATAPGAAAATAPEATAVAQPPKQRQRGCEAVKPEYDADHSRRAEYLCPRVVGSAIEEEEERDYNPAPPTIPLPHPLG
ncbi:uncharacterized protein LOC114476141 isoform X2 [Gouania willdenowi]|uniref:uncharacterized protein LOC114476141 isoform X2 n=1 Tax=Gouania willdenowi TaxID=441366 RepID=UPI001055781D|nr:uncharacterized protein LOC114476141 isoform X2 [Gouania willdenowi]